MNKLGEFFNKIMINLMKLKYGEKEEAIESIISEISGDGAVTMREIQDGARGARPRQTRAGSREAGSQEGEGLSRAGRERRGTSSQQQRFS